MKALVLALALSVLSSGDAMVWATCTTDSECESVPVSEVPMAVFCKWLALAELPQSKGDRETVEECSEAWYMEGWAR